MKLLCRRCGYDLHGGRGGIPAAPADAPLTEAAITCPECGEKTNFKQLRAHADRMRVGAREIIRRLMLWPAVLLILSAIPILGILLGWVVLIIALVDGTIIAGQTAERLAWTRALSSPSGSSHDPTAWSVRGPIFTGLLLVQLLLIALAIIGGFAFSMFLIGLV